MRVLLVCFTFLISTFMIGQDNQAQIKDALQAYDAKEYAKAIDLLNNVLVEHPENAEVHYNLANAYYQNQQAGYSIFHYEKALKIKPDFKDAQVNLEYAQKLRLDDFKGNFSISQNEMFYNLFNFLSTNSWALVTILFSVMILVTFILYISTQKTVSKKISFTLMFVFLGVMFSSLLITFHQRDFLKNSRFGIIVQKEVLMKEQPRVASQTIEKIHEGTKVLVDDRSEQWVQIRLVNDTLGWIKKEEIKEL